MANLISSLTAATFVFFLRHLPVSLLGIGKPLGTTSRSPFQFKYTSNIAAPPSLTETPNRGGLTPACDSAGSRDAARSKAQRRAHRRGAWSSLSPRRHQRSLASQIQ